MSDNDLNKIIEIINESYFLLSILPYPEYLLSEIREIHIKEIKEQLIEKIKKEFING